MKINGQLSIQEINQIIIDEVKKLEKNEK